MASPEAPRAKILGYYKLIVESDCLDGQLSWW
jgi:hypothetical protein